MAREAMRKIFINLHGDTLPEKHECQLAAWYSYFEVFDVPFGLSHLIGRVIGAKCEIPKLLNPGSYQGKWQVGRILQHGN